MMGLSKELVATNDFATKDAYYQSKNWALQPSRINLNRHRDGRYQLCYRYASSLRYVLMSTVEVSQVR